MPAAIRFRTRHLHATVYNHVRAQFDAAGWITPPVNFGTVPISVVDYQPDERGVSVAQNTVAISIGDFGSDADEELGSLGGGLRSAEYIIYADVYMAEQALSLAVCDDIRDIFTDLHLALVDQISGQPVPGTDIDFELIDGPSRPPAAVGAEQFKKFWRIMRLHGRLYYSS